MLSALNDINPIIAIANVGALFLKMFYYYSI